ncbi:hypothetical protein [Thalassotalea ganghwensis]
MSTVEFNLIVGYAVVNGRNTLLKLDIRNCVENRTDSAGLVTGGASFPQIKLNGGVNWAKDQWEASWNVSYIDDLLDSDDDVIELPKVDNYVKHGAQVSYSMPQYWESKLTLGIDNLFDEEPPILASTVDGGHDPATYSARGCYFYARLSFNF